MRLTRLQHLAALARSRAASEDGFAMAVALATLMVVTLMIGAALVAANGDIHNSQHDLDAKRAYYSARAGLNSFLYKLNKNTEFWEQCPSQAKTNVPGSTTESYSYTSLPANGKPACLTTDPVHTMIELTDGSFRMRFTGYAGPSTSQTTRTIVASFKRASPLDYLWYTIYETLDPNTYSVPANYQDCATLRRDGRPSHCVDINWVSGDVMNGPTYTQDQYRICGTPTFGRNVNDVIASAAPGGAWPGMYVAGGCGGTNGPPSGTPANVNGTLQENAPYITPPPDNTNLLTYAQTDGKVYNGFTQIQLNGNTATVIKSTGATEIVDLTASPIIYVTNGTCSSSYSPYNATYPPASGCGTVYVSGTYSSSVTIAAANDVIVTNNITTNLAGTAVLGLVANNFIRVQHGVTTRSGATQGSCGTATNVAATTHANLRIDAAVLALNHSFIVDNYDCGASLGNLTVNGAIAQLFRGTVGTTSGGSISTGYLKNYTYDDRLAVQQPPFLFDLGSSSWRVVRETSCALGSADAAVAC
jgi:hypothetical protein